MTIKEVRQFIWDVDNTPGILDFQLSRGLSIWLILRHDIYRKLLGKVLSQQPANGNSSRNVLARVKGKLADWKYHNECANRDPLEVRGIFDCLNFCATAGAIDQNGCFINKTSGFLNHFRGIETHNILISNNKKYEDNYCGDHSFFDGLILREVGKKGESLSEAQTKSITDFFFEIGPRLSAAGISKEEIASMQSSTILFGQYLPGFEKSITQLFNNLSPKFIAVEDGNYGSWHLSTIIRMANEMNIETLEIQHGIFDVAFQYGEKLISDPRLKKVKTNYVLTFGQYFSDYVRSSSRAINFGSYYLEEKLKENSGKGSPKKTILFISQHRYTDEIIPILEEALRQCTQDVNLILRLHPLELQDTRRYQKLSSQFKGRFSTSEDIYDLIREADIVIGLFSTVLFECLYFEKTPLIFRNQLSAEFIPADLGKWFDTAEELCSLIQSDHHEERSNADLYWSKNYKSNFSNFLKQIG